MNELVLGADEVDFLISRDLLVVGRFLLVSQLDHQNSWPAFLEQDLSSIHGRRTIVTSTPHHSAADRSRSIDYDTPRPIVRSLVAAGHSNMQIVKYRFAGISVAFRILTESCPNQLGFHCGPPVSNEFNRGQKHFETDDM